MSGYIPKDNSGSTFVNDRKERDSQPDERGSCRIDGVDYWQSVWIKDKGDGSPPWRSYSYTRKDSAASQQAKPAQQPKPAATAQNTIPEDEIPF